MSEPDAQNNYVPHHYAYWPLVLFAVGALASFLGGCAKEVEYVPVKTDSGCIAMSSVMPQQVSARDTPQTRRDAVHRNAVWDAACPEYAPAQSAQSASPNRRTAP